MAKNIVVAKVKNASDPQTEHKFKCEETFDKMAVVLANEFMVPLELMAERILLADGARLNAANYADFLKADLRLIELDIYDEITEGKVSEDSSEEETGAEFENKELIKLLGEIEEQGIDQYGSNPHLEFDDSEL